LPVIPTRSTRARSGCISSPLSGRLEVGQNSANVSLRPESKYGYVAVTGEYTVAVVERESLEVETWLNVGQEPMGLILV
jgi:hypothetical protein